MLAVVEQQYRPGVLQDVLLARQRMVRLQRQVHRVAAQNRQDGGVQRRRFFQAKAHHQWLPAAAQRCQQRQQALLDRHALCPQLAIAQMSAGNDQRRALAKALKAAVQLLDERCLRLAQQVRPGGVVEPVHVGQRLQPQ